MRCLSCGSDNPDGAKFCIECATPLQKRCPSCGAENLPRAKFCGECATPLARQSSVQRLESSVKKTVDAEPWISDPRRRTLDSRPVSYTPKHLAERILAEQAALETRGALEEERKTITALFADIKGSMALMEDLDP